MICWTQARKRDLTSINKASISWADRTSKQRSVHICSIRFRTCGINITWTHRFLSVKRKSEAGGTGVRCSSTLRCPRPTEEALDQSRKNGTPGATAMLSQKVIHQKLSFFQATRNDRPVHSGLRSGRFLEVEATLIKEKAGDSMDPSYVIKKTCEVQQVLLDDESIIKNE